MRVHARSGGEGEARTVQELRRAGCASWSAPRHGAGAAADFKVRSETVRDAGRDPRLVLDRQLALGSVDLEHQVPSTTRSSVSWFS
jgi:hypothetical protein